MLDHFGFLAPIYDRVIRPKDPEKLINFLQLPVSGMLLDAGGGTGRVAQGLKQHASVVVVADESLAMLEMARSKNGLTLLCTHSERLPFPDNYFERVLMVDALHHVGNQAETAAELWRVLKHGGRLVIEEPDVGNFSVKLVALAEKLALMRSHFLDPGSIARLFPLAADVRIEKEGFNAWVILEKPEPNLA
jgi:ubiquinone/menaquinone biosynthesis C-methylase UbiE